MLPGICGTMMLAAGSAGASSALTNVTYIRVRALRAGTTSDTDTFALAELKFLADPEGIAQPTTGTAIAASPTVDGSVAASAFDDNATTWCAVSAGAGWWMGYQFDSPVVIAAVRLRARTTFQNQMPRAFVVETSENGADWTTRHLFTGVPVWASGEERTFNLSDSAQDEVGGHRFWLFKNVGLNHQGFSNAYQTELYLRQGGVNIGPEYVTVFGVNIPGGLPRYAFNITTSDEEVGITQPNGYIGVDFGYKRAIDEVGITARTGGFSVQMMKQFDVMYGDIDTDIANFSVAASINDLSGAPTSGETRYYGI